MNVSSQRIGAWCGPAMMVIWLVGFILVADLIPPPSPTKDPEEVAAFFQGDTNAIRVGLVLTMLSSALLGPFYAVISTQMKRIEGAYSPWSTVQFGLGMVLIVLFLLPMLVLLAAAYRPDRDPDTLQALYDLGWLAFVAPVSTAAVQCFTLGAVILQDTGARPIFPRWSGYLNFWIGTLFLPGNFCVFVKTGPFAWNGLVCWWIPLLAFVSWYFVMAVLLLRAIRDQQCEGALHHNLSAFEIDTLRRLDLLEADVAATRG
ncbi:MAG: hypothetical protein H0X00_03365 [Sporichthya sp.]|nr:hypothetical protein [Sporichthya sp.]